MLNVLWLLLAVLVIAKVALYKRNRIPKPDHNLDRQIYRLNQVVAMAHDNQVYREIRAIILQELDFRIDEEALVYPFPYADDEQFDGKATEERPEGDRPRDA